MKKRKIPLILCCALLSACSTNKQGIIDNEDQLNSTREIKTYFSYDFDELEVGEEVPAEYFDFNDGGGFIASSKDRDGNVFVKAKEVFTGSMWGFNAKAPRDKDGNQIPLENYSIEFTTRIPYKHSSHISDGGINLMFSSMIGRYDLALCYDSPSEGKNSSINLWMSHAPSGEQKFASTSDTSSGSKITNFALYPGQEYRVTVCVKYTGKNSRCEDICTIYVFVDNTLVIQQANILFWVGGYGLRGYQSDWEYGSFKVSDFPLICPDGKDHFSENVSSETKTLTKLATPILEINGDLVRWSAIENASYYDIFDGSTNFVARLTTNEMKLSDYFSGTGNFKLLAGSDTFGYLRSDYASGNYVLAEALIAPTLQVKNTTILYWNEIEHATGYELFYEGESFIKLPNTVFEYDCSGYENDFQVRALGDGNNHLSSPLSNAVSPARPTLSTPKITYYDGAIRWEEVENASSYKIFNNNNLLKEVNTNYYETSEYGKYYVVAIPSDLDKFKESNVSNTLVVRKTSGVYYDNNFSDKSANEVIDMSLVGWGIYYNDGRVWEAKKEYKDGAMWVGVTNPYDRSYSPDVAKQWSGTYFPATDNGAYLTNWTYTSDILIESSGPDGYDFFQMIFATQKAGGRYAMDFKVYKETVNGETNTHAVIGLYDNNNCYVYIDNVDFSYDIAHKLTINYSLQENNTARISLYLDNTLLFDEYKLPTGIGDFGFSIIGGNPMFTNIKVNDIPYQGPDGEDRY